MVVTVIMTAALLLADSMVNNGYQAMAEASERYILAQQAATNLEIGSDNLTIGARSFVVTGDIVYLQNYYDFMRHDLDMSKNALLLVDVDKFKGVNDTYGHDVGDLVLKRVAEVLTYSSNSTDLVFRLGGDEFMVIMANVDSSMRDKLKRKIDHANIMLQKPKGDLPPTSISVGVAFADRENPEGDIFKDADTALYRMKSSGRCGCYIYRRQERLSTFPRRAARSHTYTRRPGEAHRRESTSESPSITLS